MASSPLSITPFPSFQVPGYQAKWIVSANWDEEDFAYYKGAKLQNAGQILKPPPSYGNKREHHGYRMAQMILVLSDRSKDHRQAVAEIHIFRQRYTTAFIFVSCPDQSRLATDLRENAVGSLISMCFFHYHCDQARLLFLTEMQKPAADRAFPWGEMRELSSFPNHPTLFAARQQVMPLIRFQQRIISRGYWDESHREKIYYQQLSYIRKKEARKSIQAKLSQKKVRRRSLLARIFRPKIDDSLF
ncbi:MAG: hypothetical protein ACOH5I_04075 [Oligoflexus sp.]